MPPGVQGPDVRLGAGKRPVAPSMFGALLSLVDERVELR